MRAFGAQSDATPAVRHRRKGLDLAGACRAILDRLGDGWFSIADACQASDGELAAAHYSGPVVHASKVGEQLNHAWRNGLLERRAFGRRLEYRKTSGDVQKAPDAQAH